MMKYKGYTALPEIDADSGIIFGRVVGLRDVITFQGTSVSETVQAFHDSVDDYLELCAQRGEQPEKPYSGHFVVRIEPELHRALANWAEVQSLSLNRAVESVLETVFGALISGAPAGVDLLPGTTTRSIGLGPKKPRPSQKKKLKSSQTTDLKKRKHR
jgi:predicted HicB family RNase H-like nuclease